MKKQLALKVWLELIWWLITALIIFLVLYPIHQAMYVWPFQTRNIISILVVVTLTRYVFLFPHTFVARQQIWKIALILLMFPLTFAMISSLNGFMTYIEEQTWDALTGHLPTDAKRNIETYIWTEMIFFGAGSVLTPALFAIRLFLSVWRQHNRGTV